MWNYLKKIYLRAERAVWEPEEPALLSERERNTRFSEKSRNAHHYFLTVILLLLKDVQRVFLLLPPPLLLLLLLLPLLGLLFVC